jgi:hypothetical protein
MLLRRSIAHTIEIPERGVVDLAPCSENLSCHVNPPTKPIRTPTEVGRNQRHPTIAMFIRAFGSAVR